MLEGGQVDLGGHLAVLGRRLHRRASSGGHVLRFRRRDESRGPAVPPSLAAGARAGSPLIGVALPGLLARGVVRVPGLSSGGSGVIFTPRTPPGSHRPRVAHGCVRRYSSPPRLSLRPVYGAGADRGRPDFRRRRRAGVPGRAPAAPDANRRRDAGPRGGLPGGELGTTDADLPPRRPGRRDRRRAPLPRAGVDLSSQHDSRARSHYVKGSRPWWRRRPPRRAFA